MSENSEKTFLPQANKSDRHVTWTDAAKVTEKGEKSNNQQNEWSTSANTSILKGSYTQIMVNPTQLSEHEFTNWMEKLMEARKNRQGRKERPYRSYRKPYNPEQGSRRPQLRNRLRRAQEMDVQNIMTAYNCNYDDVVEAVDLYNLDVEDSQTA